MTRIMYWSITAINTQDDNDEMSARQLAVFPTLKLATLRAQASVLEEDGHDWAMVYSGTAYGPEGRMWYTIVHPRFNEVAVEQSQRV